MKLHRRPESILAATCAIETVESSVDTVTAFTKFGAPMACIEVLDQVQMRGMNLLHAELGLPDLSHPFLEFYGGEASVREQLAGYENIAESFGEHNFAVASKTI